MSTYISILRGINVSGKNKIKMQDLKGLYGSLGFSNVLTYIQSGNVIFTSSKKDTAKLASTIKLAIKKQFGYEVPTQVRTTAEFLKIFKNNPFKDKDLSKVHVTFFASAPSKDFLQDLGNAKAANEEFLLQKDVIYLYCPNGYGKTKLSNTFIEKKAKVLATTRNWKTITALSGLVN